MRSSWASGNQAESEALAAKGAADSKKVKGLCAGKAIRQALLSKKDENAGSSSLSLFKLSSTSQVMFRLIDESRFTPEEIHQSRRRVDMIEWEQRLLEITSGGEGLSVVLHELALSAEAILPGALGAITLLGADGRRLQFGSAPNLPSEFIQAVAGLEIGANSGSCGTAAYLKEAVLVSDINEDPRWSSLRHLASPYGLRACWSVPLLSRRGRVLGTLDVYFQEPRVATPEDVSTLERTAHYAAVAIEMKGAEQELRALTQLLIDAKSLAQVGTWRLELSSNQVTLSAEVCEVFGLSRESSVHSLEFLLSLVHLEDVALVKGWLNASLAYEEPGVLDFRLLPAGENIRIIRAQCSLIHDEQQRPFLLLGTVQDVTEGSRAEAWAEALRRTRESQMELLFESSIAGAALVTLDGYFLKVNPAFCALTGFSEAELLNLRIKEIYPDDITKIYGALESIIQGHAESFELEKRCLHKNGLLVWCLVSITLLRDDQGSPLHLIWHIRDIADRKRDEQRIFEVESQFRAAFENASGGISISDLAGRALMVNEAYASYLGYRSEELLSTDLTRLVHPEDLEVFYGLGTQLFHGEVPRFECESRHIHKDGRIVWIKSRVSLTRDAQGQPLNFIALSEDVTERRLAKAERENLLLSERAARNEAERANQLKNEFLSTLSHELRTPLNAILGWVELLKDSEDDPETFAEGLAVISRNVRAQSKLIDDLLELNRIESGHVSFERKPVDVAGVISAAVEVVRSAATVKSIGIVVELCGAAVSVMGDEIRLQQVVWNFLSNAVKFTPEGGRVIVRLKRVGACAEISVSDDGAGIRAEFLPHVFDRFRQQDSATTRLHGGLGIGLTLAKEFVELHGGTVAAASLGEGRGSTFTATLPLILEHGGDAESELYPPLSRGATLSLDGVRILIVDDQEDTRVLVTHTLEAEGGRVSVASNAVEGLALVRETRPHVILSDIGMPVHDGYTFIKWVRSLSNAEGGRTTAAAFTAFARPQDKAFALANGFQLHVVKPVSRKQLVSAVMQLLAQGEMP